MPSFTFIHAADLHLDSPFAGITARAPHIREAMIRASYDAYKNLVDLCLEQDAAFLLAAGDVFDWEDRSLKAQLAFRDGTARLAERGIQTFVVHGNHDPVRGRFAAIGWPPGVHVFGHGKVETVVAERGGAPLASVSGVSYRTKGETRNLAADFSSCPREPGLFSIGLLHASVGSSPDHAPYAPCKLEDLTSSGLDYWALGHHHAAKVLHENPHVVYSGNTQGRFFKESGPRGAYVVRVRDGRTESMEFRAVDAVHFLSEEISIAPHATLDSLAASLEQAVAGMADQGEGRPVICRVDLTGRGALFSELAKPDTVPHLLETVRERYCDNTPFAWLEEIRPRFLPQASLEERMEQGDLLGIVLRAMADAGQSPEQMQRIAEEALGPVFNHRLISKCLPPLGPEDLGAMMAAARLLCFDLLEEGDP